MCVPLVSDNSEEEKKTIGLNEKPNGDRHVMNRPAHTQCP